MHLIIGGAYMGKLDFARSAYGFTSEEIFSCTQNSVDFSCPCVTHMEEFTYGCVLRGEDPVEYFRSNRQDWENSVLICRDISGGVVPIDKTDRAWRAATGKLCQYLAKEANKVSRVFCGLEQQLK